MYCRVYYSSHALMSYEPAFASLSLQTGKLPARYKTAQVLIIPLLKKTGLDSSLPANYRPISNLSTVSMSSRDWYWHACGLTCSALPTSVSTSPLTEGALHGDGDGEIKILHGRVFTAADEKQD